MSGTEWSWVTLDLPPENPSPEWGDLVGFCRNEIYWVLMFERDTHMGRVKQLSIARVDEGPDVPWRDKWRIKNELAGPGCSAVEMFPPESELVDQCNHYHLWVLPETLRLPFSIHVPKKEEC